MKGSAYNDSVLVSEAQLSKTDQDKSSSIKERFNALIAHGVLDDGSSPLSLDYGGGTTINISGGEAYCDFDKTNTSPEYGNTGERIYASSSLSDLAIKGGIIAGGDPRHFFAVYVELHKNRKLDEVNVAHYTEKEDSYIIAQLTNAELASLNSTGSVYVADNYVHSTQTDLTALSDEELNDTFGSSRWDRTTDFLVDIPVTEFNSVYLGTADDVPSVATEYGTRVRPIMFIHEDVLNLPDIEDIAQENHRSKQHSNGIMGSITSFQATVDGIEVPDELNITDLSNDEFGYIGGHRVGTGDIAIGYLSGIQATNDAYFPDGGYEYYIYVYYDAGTGLFKTTAFKVTDVPSALVSNGEDNYLLIGKVFIDAGRNTIEAYEDDKRYDPTASDNHITDLRKFGTIDSINISDDGFSSIAGDNLISNGEFEEGITNDVPNEWNGTGTFSLDNTNLLGGKHSLAMSQNSIVLSNPIPYNKLATYNLRVAVKASGTSGTYTLGVRGYVGKDWTDVAINSDDTLPTNISYVSVIIGGAKTTSWTDSGTGILSSGSWAWTTPDPEAGRGDYDSGDLDLIKYFRVFIRANNDGASTLYVDNIKLTSHNSSYVDVETAQTIAGSKTFTGVPRIQSVAPRLGLEELGASANNGKWEVGADGENFFIRTLNDAGDTLVKALDISRTLTVVDLINVLSTNLQHNSVKVPTISSTDTLTNKRLTSPKINSASTTGITSEELETLSGGGTADSLHTHSASPSHTITSHSDVIDATGAQLETLTGGGSTALHSHAIPSHTIASHSDTTATGTELNTLTGGGSTALHSHAIPSHTIASHSDTTATGAELNTLTGGGSTALHYHAGTIVQSVNTKTGAVNTATEQFIPFDDSIPVITDGAEYMTRAITPTNSANTLRITVVANLATSSSGKLTVALFQDTTTNALAVSSHLTSDNAIVPITLVYEMVAGTTSSTTFKIRAGSNVSGTVTFNGSGGARKWGGVLFSSVSIMELAA